MSPTAASPQSACPLFRLPPELRNEIYHHILCIPDALTWKYAPRLQHDSSRTTPDPQDITALRINRLHPKTGGETVLAILQTCRLINHEAAGIFYNTHEWYLQDKDLTPAPVDWFSVEQPRQDLIYTLSAPRLEGFHSLIIEIASLEGLVKAAVSLKHLPNLRSLKLLIKAEVGTRKWPEEDLTVVFREIEDWGKLASLEVRLLVYGHCFETLRTREKMERRVERIREFLGQAVRRIEEDDENETSEEKFEVEGIEEDVMDEREE